MTALEQLRHVMQPPSTGTHIDWDDITAAYGTQFPFDYRDFLSEYGTGEIEGMMAVFAPSTDPELPLRHTSRLPADVLDQPEVDEWNDPRHAELYDPADVMVWGETVEADVLGWITSSDEPNTWPVAVYTHGGEWRVYGCTMTEFLLKLLTGDFERNPTGLTRLFGRGSAEFTAS
ncbi:hypothetical protein ACFY7C_36440 [Streptomyces sp. NPDC012769]|uniref:hypothetical protein n=1 Tax=Streptomyces sp. NPDC012769 TaxID=3364848 RepID=UPI0036CD94B9